MKKLILLLIVAFLLVTIFPVAVFAADDEPPGGTRNATTYVYSDEDIEIAAKTVFAEANGEPMAGKVAVANVILNRFESNKFGESVKDVVTAPHQFANSEQTNEDCLYAAKLVLCYNIRLLPTNTYYFRRSESKEWRDFVYWGRIGEHSFYTDGAPIMPAKRFNVLNKDAPDYIVSRAVEIATLYMQLDSG